MSKALLALIAGFFFLAAPGFAAEAQAPAPQTAIAMHGKPAHASGLSHFDYVNPEAPKGGMLKLGVTGNFDSFNPFIVRGQPALGLNTGYLSLVYEPLMARSWDEPFTLYGLIAASIEVPEDRSSITFNLDPRAHWSDGVAMTAEDVLFSFTTLRDQGRPNHRTYYKKVAAAEKIGDRKIKFSFKRNTDGSIDREMPLIMGLMPVLPVHIWKDRDFNQTSLQLPVGSGPYKIATFQPGRSVTYQRDPHYWGAEIPVMRGLYNFEMIRIDYYRDDSIALQAFKAGQFDLRRETDANKWATAFDFPASRDGRVKLELLPHHRTEQAYGFIFNTRRDPFKDPVLRAALQYAFDFGWINRNLFHGAYHRTTSFFPNSELAAPPLPDAKERAFLEKVQAPAVLLTEPVTPPTTDGTEASLRANLLKASAMLQDKGYVLKKGVLYAPGDSKPLIFEILLSDPIEEKVALTWTRALKRLGISARIHTVDSAQYQARLSAFDYDITTGKWTNSLSPGNEQIAFWGSAAADQEGSRNYPGIKDPLVDKLANAIPAAATREDLITTVRALDRVLMAGHYIVPFYYSGADMTAWWVAHLQHPATMPLYGNVLESWWAQ